MRIANEHLNKIVFSAKDDKISSRSLQEIQRKCIKIDIIT